MKTAFQKNRDQYVEGVHYLILEGSEFESFIKENNNPKLPNAVRRAFLWTELGVSVYARTINTPDALETYKKLKNSYFKSSINEFDIMRKMLDILENTKNQIEEARLISYQALNKAKSLEDKIHDRPDKGYVKASSIAVHLNLYSKTGLPHVQLVSAIARALAMKIRTSDSYEDEDIAIINEAIEDTCYWQVYYKPRGAEKIIDWFEKNKESIEFTDYYKINIQGHKKGEVKIHGYILNNIHYKVQ